MAEGYTRARAGNIGVCIGTSGPAGTDVITGLYSAWGNSIPIGIRGPGKEQADAPTAIALLDQVKPPRQIMPKLCANLEKGCDYLDAPVSGGDVGAKAARLTIMVGGPQRAFDKVEPLFELMGKNMTLVGDNGDGQTTKVANQIIVALTIEAVAEALLFASKAGADPAKVRQALMGGFANSRILEVHGERMVNRNFDPGFRIELHQKDLNLALQGARSCRSACPTQRPARSCSTPVPPTAARPGTIPAWSGRWR